MSAIQATRICAVCQKPFVCKEGPAHIAKGAGKFCSRVCQGLSKRIPEADKFLKRTCAGCGKSFLIEPSEAARGGGVYCGTACYHEGRKRPLVERFWEKVNRDGPVSPSCPELGPCWLWTGATGEFGYGVIFDPASPRTQHHNAAHRVSWEMHNGPIPEGLYVLHRCDVASCVRPDHLFLGTLKDNTQDMLAKDRQGFAHDHSQGEKNPAAKLTEEQVVAMRNRYALGNVTQRKLAEEHGVCRALISAIINRRMWPNC